MIRTTEDWTSTLAERSPLDELDGRVLAIEAAHYLSRILTDPQYKEPLLPALGGLPFAMKRLVENDLDNLRSRNITPVFVFNGLDVGKKDRLFRISDAAQINANAWELYNQHHAQRAVETFGTSCTQARIYRTLVGVMDGELVSINPDDLCCFLQSILREKGVKFMVAPYNALAQLAYMERQATDYVDAVSGSSDLLLFDVERVISSWDFKNEDFMWVRRLTCMMELGNIPSDMFVDACILSGSSFLPALPQLSGSSRNKQPKIRHAVEMMMGLGRSGISVCLQYQDDPQFRIMDYLDKYKRTRLAVKHHVILTVDGKVEPFDVEHAPGDIHEFIGQRLPNEIYYYLSQGILGTRVLSWRTTSEILEPAPFDGGESEDYHALVRDKLPPYRAIALSLLSHSLHRFYQHSDVDVRCWFDAKASKTISMKDLTDPRSQLENWNVRSQSFGEPLSKLQTCGSLGFVVRCLGDAEFARKTVMPKDAKKPLCTREEILYNSLWRFLQLRDYVDSKHTLTPWGEALRIALEIVDGNHRLEESVFVGMELARLKVLNSKPMFPTYSGAPMRGSEKDKQYNLLISRTACLAQMQHDSIGFTGPLSRHLLAYLSMTSTVRNSLRDLVEVSVTSLFLNGDAERERTDFTDIGLDLPFLISNDCGLSIAVKSYLDELLAYPDPTSTEVKKGVLEKAEEVWFPKVLNFTEDLKVAFRLWDAIYAGLKSSPNLIRDITLWGEADEWLSQRRLP